MKRINIGWEKRVGIIPVIVPDHIKDWGGAMSCQ